MIGIPGKSYRGRLPALTAKETEIMGRMRGHVRVLAEEIGERNARRYRQLQQAADYISDRLRNSGYSVKLLQHEVNGMTVSNLEAEIRGTTQPEEVVILGAHYDSVVGSPGADDNASGVAAMIEIASDFRSKEPARTVRFLAFVNEEPPYFQTESMGSLMYARWLKKRAEKVVAMYSIETIGYYSDLPGSQRYPPPLGLLFPETGNFIGFVSNIASRHLLHRAVKTFRGTTRFPSEAVAAPGIITGIGWSDQWAFWQEGYPGIMITDTAVFRYPYYHSAADTFDRLDYGKMARVACGLARVLEQEAGVGRD